MSRIVKLSEETVNRIAAGEVVQRPGNALKEMVENSIDAGATCIKILVSEGGLKLLRISDNGIGIASEDLPLLCERFATSKLRHFEDLTAIGTFGFRGEAMASISHVARVTATSRTSSQNCGYRATFRGGRLVDALTPCAAEQGTTLVVEDMFHGTRRKAFEKSKRDLHSHIVKVVSSYAVYYGGRCSFVLSKSKGSEDVNTTKCNSPVEAARALYRIKRDDDIVEFSSSKNHHSLQGFCSVVSATDTFLLFVNDRLVESSAMKRVVQEALGGAGEGRHSSFVFLSIRVPPDQLDVNLHPTKREVRLLHEPEVLRDLKDTLVALDLDSSREIVVQSVVTTTTTKRGEDPSKMIRTDGRDQLIDPYLVSTPGAFAGIGKSRVDFEETLCGYDSIRFLIDTMTKEEDAVLARKLRTSVLVGSCGSYVFVQEGPNLSAIDADTFGKELFRQLAIRRFGRTPTLHLSDSFTVVPPLDSKRSLAVLKEYFNVEIEDGNTLVALPELLPNHIPLASAIPDLIKALRGVDFSDETRCFDGISRALADCYSKNRSKIFLETLLFPALKHTFRPPPTLSLLDTAALSRLYRIFERC